MIFIGLDTVQFQVDSTRTPPDQLELNRVALVEAAKLEAAPLKLHPRYWNINVDLARLASINLNDLVTRSAANHPT